VLQTKSTDHRLSPTSETGSYAAAGNKGTTTEQIDREQIFRCMTPPQNTFLPLPIPESHSGFSMVLMLAGVPF
jgi:hypothetical protein